MEINDQLIKKIAKLARLELAASEIKEFVPQLKEVLDAMSKLQEVDTKETGPSFQPVEIKNRMREDKIKPGFYQNESLSLTENKLDGYFKGPKAIE